MFSALVPRQACRVGSGPIARGFSPARCTPAFTRPGWAGAAAGGAGGRTLRHVHSSGPSPKTAQVANASDISHAHFLADADPSSDFNPTQKPKAGMEEANKWEGRLSPTTSHLFKLVLPLPIHRDQDPEPTAFLLHPSQPLSHLSRLIAGSLPASRRDVEITYLALTGEAADLDSHLRDAESEEAKEKEDKRQEGGPYLGERVENKGKLQEVSWSQSTDLSDFIKQACLDERFKIVIQPAQGDQLRLEVVIPSFESRTRYIRKRLLTLTRELDHLTKQKKRWVKCSTPSVVAR